MNASIDVESPTPEKIEKAKYLYTSQGYTFIGSGETGMHVENQNSFSDTPRVITLYFTKPENYQ